MDFSRLIQFLLLFDAARVKDTLAETKLFFIVGLGRSGTAFLSHLLDKVNGIDVYHETPNDRNALIDAYRDPMMARKYLTDYRGRLIAARIIESRNPIYGEVNSYLRYHVEALEELWNPIIMHLARDGRAVVRSAMNRGTFAQADRDHSGRLEPHPNNFWYEKWPEMDRFSRVCWYWADTNQYLLKLNIPLVRFEDVISSYNEFAEQILQPLSVELSSSVWEENVRKPKNVSETQQFPAWNHWTDRQKQIFESICGDVMFKLGYTF